MSARHHRLEGFQSGFADVVFDPFGVPFRRFLIDPKAQEKRHHDTVTPTAGPCQFLSLRGEKNGSIPLAGNEACLL